MNGLVRGLVVATSIAAISAGLALASGSAQAAWVAMTENGLPGHLSLLSDLNPTALVTLSPGSPVHWQIKAELTDASSPLTLQLDRQGALAERPDGLQLQVRACDTEWTNFPAAPHCPAPVTVLATTPASSPAFGAAGASGTTSPFFVVGTLTRDVGKFVLVTLSLPDTPAARADTSLMGLEVTLGIGLTVSGDVVTTPVTPGPGLAYTGADALGTALLAFGILGLGVVLRSRRSARNRDGVTS